MRNPTYLFALGLFVLLSAHGVQATQVVVPAANASGGTFAGGPANWSVTRGGGQQLVFWGRYNSNIANESGLGLNIQYDATKITGVVVDQVLNKCLVQLPVVTVNGASSMVQIGWADSSQRANGAVGWPSTADDVTHPCFVPPTCIQDPINDPLCNPQPLYTAQTGAFPVPTNLFRVTATTAAGFTSGTSTITISSSSKSSAACPCPPGTTAFTDNTLVVSGAPIGFMDFVSASSRKTHGGAGDFDIAIDPAGSMTAGQLITVEPRAMGSGYKIVFLFTGPPTSAGVTTSSGSGLVTFAGNEATVTLTGVTDLTRVQVDLTNVNGIGLAATARIGFALGDTNGSRLVNSTDILTVKSNSGATASALNFKSDLNASGLVNSTDILTVKASSGHSLP